MSSTLERRILYFSGDKSVEVRTEPLSAPNSHEVLVETAYSAISSGTELLVYRGQLPDNIIADEALDSVQSAQDYPMPYGYSTVGRVTSVGDEVDPSWKGQRVFGFQPHTSAYVARPDDLVELPDELSLQEGLFIPNIETAVNLVMDGRPVIGEKVVVFGVGIVGLLTTRLLAQFPIGSLIAIDKYANRREAALEFGADYALDPDDPQQRHQLKDLLKLDCSQDGPESASGADLVYELTGQPHVLNDAIELCGYESRVIVGSWYGQKEAPIQLGGRFHRRRISIRSSQVSTIASRYQGRWSKGRRLEVVLAELEGAPVEDLITDEYTLNDVASAFRSLAQSPNQSIQCIIKY